MSARNKNTKCLMQNYENILKNCRESLEKYKLLTDPPSARQISAQTTLRRETSREGDSCECHETSACSRPDFELHEESLRRLECSKWVETLPPVWDEFLEKDYVECVVHELILGRSETSSVTSGRSEDERRVSDVIEPEREKRDQAVLVKESDLEDDVQAVWKPVDSRSANSIIKKTLHYKGTALKTPTPLKKPSPAVVISSKGRVLTTVKKAPIPSKSGSKGRIVAPVAKAPLPPNAKKAPIRATPKSSPTSISNKTSTPQSLRNYTVQSKLSSYTRFVGKPRKFPIDFSAEHPGLVLEDTLEATLFPCRLNKLDSDKSNDAGDEKSNVSTGVVPIYTKEAFPRSPSDEQVGLRNSGKISWEYSDKTWQEVLLEGADKTKGRRILRLERKEEEVSSTRSEEPVDRDVIYDSANVVRPAERVVSGKLKVQRLPVLCIRGQCKVQKIVEISIDGAVAGGPNEDRANVRFFEYNHTAEQISKSPKGTKDAQNMKIQSDRDESEKEVEVIKDEDNQQKLGENKISVETLQKYQLPEKTKNRFIAPFLETNSIEQKIGASQRRPELPSSSQERSIPSTSGAVNDFSEEVSGSAQTDDEKWQKETFSKTSSSFTNPTTSGELHQSNQQKESIGGAVQSSSGVSHFLQDENIQLKLNDTGEVGNILKEVFSGSEEAEGGGDDEGIPGGRGTASVGIDCADLTTRIETCVQTEDMGGYYYSGGLGKELTNSSHGEKTLDQIIGRICRDQTDAFRKFKLWTAPNPVASEGTEGTTPEQINFNVTNANDLGIDDKLPGILHGESSAPPPEPADKSPRSVNTLEFRANNYTDNLGAIKGDEVEEKSHQPYEVSSSSCLGSHGNFLGLQCYCRQHRWRDSEEGQKGASGGRKDREFACEPILSPLRDLYDPNFRLNSPLMQFNYENSPEKGFPEKGFQDKGTRDSQKRLLEANPRFSRTLAKIYDAAPNVTARPSSQMDPEVQRAVNKFLDSLLESQSPASDRRGRYTKLNNVPSPPPPRAGPPISGATSKGWISTSTSPSSSSSPEHCCFPDQRIFSSLWKSTCDSTTLSDTESSDLQRMLYAPLWKDLSKKTKRDDFRVLTRLSTSSTDPGPNKQPQPSEGSQASHHHHQGARDMSEGEVLSLGEVRSLDS